MKRRYLCPLSITRPILTSHVRCQARDVSSGGSCGRREDDADRRAAVLALMHRQIAVERSGALRELVEAAAAPLPGGVVLDRGLEAAVLRLADRQRKALGRGRGQG